MKTARVEQGDNYYFVSIMYWKVCRTIDCYFPTDNKKYKEGNYFLSPRAAHQCMEGINELYGPSYFGIKDALGQDGLREGRRKELRADLAEITGKINTYIKESNKTL